jgi:hypothetical protein
MIVIVRRNNGGTKPLERQNMIVISATARTKIALLLSSERRFQRAKTYLRLAVDRPQP